MELKLKAENRNEELVLEYLKNNVSPILAEKINKGKKTLQGCWNFITGEAKKKAVSGCACIEDAEVFGWAMHYFEEDAIKECKTAPSAKVTATKKEAPAPKEEEAPKPVEPPKEEIPKAEPPKKAKPASKKKAKADSTIFEEQTSLFDMFG
jgi:hypothetical protein